MQHMAALANILKSRETNPLLIYNCDESMVEITDSKVPRVVTLKSCDNVYATTEKGGQVSHITLVATIRFERVCITI